MSSSENNEMSDDGIMIEDTPPLRRQDAAADAIALRQYFRHMEEVFIKQRYNIGMLCVKSLTEKKELDDLLDKYK